MNRKFKNIVSPQFSLSHHIYIYRMNSGEPDQSRVVSLQQSDTNDESKKRKEQPTLTAEEIRQKAFNT